MLLSLGLQLFQCVKRVHRPLPMMIAWSTRIRLSCVFHAVQYKCMIMTFPFVWCCLVQPTSCPLLHSTPSPHPACVFVFNWPVFPFDFSQSVDDILTVCFQKLWLTSCISNGPMNAEFIVGNNANLCTETRCDTYPYFFGIVQASARCLKPCFWKQNAHCTEQMCHLLWNIAWLIAVWWHVTCWLT